MTKRTQTLEELRKSEDRAVLVDGKWDDRWAAKQTGQKHYYITPVEQEKYIPHGKGERYAKTLKGELLPAFFLASLYDYEKGCMVPAAVKMGFKTGDWYWAKENCPGLPDYARMVDLLLGGVNVCHKDVDNVVRPVRVK